MATPWPWVLHRISTTTSIRAARSSSTNVETDSGRTRIGSRVLVADAWQRVAQIPRPVTDDGFGFGSDVALSGDWIFASSQFGPSDENDESFLYTFFFDGADWGLVDTLEVGATFFPVPVTVNGNRGFVAVTSEIRDGVFISPGAARLRGLALTNGRWSFVSPTAQAPDDQFGANALDLGDDGLLVAGSPGSRSEAGVVFTFEDATQGSASVTERLFQMRDLPLRVGAAVAIRGSVAVAGGDSSVEDVAVVGEGANSAVLVGAPGADRVVVFEEQRIGPAIAQGAVEGMRFGHAVSIDSGRLLIGAPGLPDEESNLDYGGSAFLYTRDASGAYAFSATLTDELGSARDRFGFSVALRGGRALIGAPSYDVIGDVQSGQGIPSIDGESAGLAFFLDEDAQGMWSISTVFFGSRAFRGLGRSVILLDDRAFVGRDDIGDDATRSVGALFELEFAEGAWSETRLLRIFEDNESLGGEVDDALGRAMAFDQGTLLVGAPGRGNGGGGLYIEQSGAPDGGSGDGGGSDGGGSDGDGDGGSGGDGGGNGSGGGSSSDRSSEDDGCAAAPGASILLLLSGLYRRRRPRAATRSTGGMR